MVAVQGGFRWTDPVTSRAAIDGMEVSKLQKAVFDYIKSRSNGKGVTDEDIVRFFTKNFGYAESSARKRRTELVRLGLVKSNGITRLTSNGRARMLWVVKPGE